MTEIGVQVLAQRGLGLPLQPQPQPISSDWLDFMVGLAPADLVRRPCRRCRRFLLVPPRGGSDFDRFWGTTPPPNPEYLCLRCYQTHHRAQTTSPLALALQEMQAAEPVEPSTVQAAWNPQEPPWLEPVKRHPQTTPSERTVRFVALLIARTDGWLDLETLSDLVAGAKIVVVKNGEKRRFDGETLADLPSGGADLDSAHSQGEITSLLAAAVEFLERSNLICQDEIGNLYRSKSSRQVCRTHEVQQSLQSIVPPGAEASTLDVAKLDQQTLLTYRTALTKVISKHPDLAANRWAVRVLSMALVFPGEEWQESYFDLCWGEFERVHATKTA